MQLAYEEQYPVPLSVAWDVLLDPLALSRRLPGCRALTPAGAGAYEAVLEIGIGPIKGTYTGRVLLEDVRPCSSYRLVVEGGGGPGQVRGSGRVELSPAGDGLTRIRCAGDASVTGALAGVGQRLLSGVAHMLMAAFFRGMGEEMLARLQLPPHLRAQPRGAGQGGELGQGAGA